MFKNKKNNLDNVELINIIEGLKRKSGILEDTLELLKLGEIDVSTGTRLLSIVDKDILEIIDRLQKFQNSSNC